MKHLFTFIVFIFFVTTLQTRAQEITATLAGTGSSYGFSVNDADPTTLFRVRGDGNVGIGTTSPIEILHVYNSSGSVHPIIESGDNYSGLQLKDGRSEGVTWGLFSGYPIAGDLTIRESGVADYVTVKKSSGNFGIGTTNPEAKLNVNVGPYGYIRLDYGSGGASGLDMWEDGTRRALLVYDSTPNIEEWSFYAGEFNTKKMVIENTGNVGIGTNEPQGVLDVVSTTGALIVPRMTTTQRDALTAVNGMIIYNSSTNLFNFYEGGTWVTK